LIDVRNLHKSFGHSEILKGISTHVDEREVVVVIGPSGSGKSTLLRCLNGLETVTSGEIEIAGMMLTDPKTNIHKLRQHVGMVFQQFNLFKHLTILENITIGQRKVKKVTVAEADKVARALLANVGMVGKEASYPDELSGGQQQRVAIARALAIEGITMVVVTHEMDFAREVGHRVVFMDDGRIVEEGAPKALFSNPQMDRTKGFLAKIL
jgi:polar amino acid transport system ATP-binding protein